jgi:hypothetical protein
MGDYTGAERQRRYMARLKAAAGSQSAVTNGATVKDREIAALKAQIAELEAAQKGGQGEYILAIERENSTLRGQLERQQRQSPKADKPPLPPDEARDRRIKALETRVRNLRAELHASQEWNRGKDGSMNFKTMAAISKVLHPDREPSEAERVEACKLFTAWKATRDAARRGAN